MNPFRKSASSHPSIVNNYHLKPGWFFAFATIFSLVTWVVIASINACEMNSISSRIDQKLNTALADTNQRVVVKNEVTERVAQVNVDDGECHDNAGWAHPGLMQCSHKSHIMSIEHTVIGDVVACHCKR